MTTPLLLPPIPVRLLPPGKNSGKEITQAIQFLSLSQKPGRKEITERTPRTKGREFFPIGRVTGKKERTEELGRSSLGREFFPSRSSFPTRKRERREFFPSFRSFR